MEIKFELDTEKTMKAITAGSAAYGLTTVSVGTNGPQFAAASMLALIAIVYILFGQHPPALKRSPQKNYSIVCCLDPQKNCSIVFCLDHHAILAMTPDSITLWVKERPLKPSLSSMGSCPMKSPMIQEILLPLLMVIPYNLLTDVVHSLTSIMTETKDKTDHMHTKFMRLGCLPLYYNTTIGNDATTVAYVRAKTAHKFHLNDYSSFKVDTCGIAKSLCNKINVVWYNGLKDAKTYNRGCTGEF